MMHLSENIRAQRLQRGWTQQQLAEAMEVSIGAVSKWESGQSRPELETLMRLAALFDVSTDVLLGFQRGMEGAEALAGRIDTLRIDKQYAQASELAEMALLKYPNDFRIAYRSALLYQHMQMELQDEAAGLRALHCFDRAEQLLKGSDVKDVSPQVIRAKRALVLSHRGQFQEALQLYRDNNVNGINDMAIGSLLFQMEQYKEALSPLSSSYLSALAELYNSLIHLGQCLIHTGKVAEGLQAIQFLEGLVQSLVQPRPSYAERMLSALLVVKAGVLLHLQQAEPAEEALRAAIRYARRYDDAPNPYADAVLHYHGPHRSLGDRMGGSLLEGLGQEVLTEGRGAKLQGLTLLWQRLLKEEQFEG